MAESVSLAVLENLVHMSREDFPTGYVTVVAVIPDEIDILTEEDLAARSAGYDHRQLGDQWIDSRASVVLQVRSAVVPLEHSFLLNPAHPQFAHILVEQILPFTFDERLFGGERD